MKRRSFADLVADFQAMPRGDLDREIKWFVSTIPTLQRMKAAAMLARRRQRRKVPAA